MRKTNILFSGCLLVMLIAIVCCSQKPEIPPDLISFKETCNEFGSQLLGLGGRKLPNTEDVKGYIAAMDKNSENIQSWKPDVQEKAKNIIVLSKRLHLVFAKGDAMDEINKAHPNDIKKQSELYKEADLKFKEQLLVLEAELKAKGLIENFQTNVQVGGVPLAGAIAEFFEVTKDIKLAKAK